MATTQENVPSLRTPKEIGLEKLRPYLLDPREDYPEPYYMLEYDGVPFSTVGGIQAISGQKKNGKSFVLTQLMAAVLGTGSEKVEEFLPGLRVPQRTIDYLGHLPKVLYVDTEMEKLNSAKVLRRVHWLCGWDMKIPNERFNVLWLKTMPKDEKESANEMRFEYIKLAIEILSPDIVFIDGLRDLLASINDEETASRILNYLSALAEERHMCIWNALHQNPKANSGGEDKMRGWAGTELGNKVSDTLVSIKNKKPDGVTFIVKQQDARGKDLPDWSFIVTDDAGDLGIPKIINTPVEVNSKSKRKGKSTAAETILTDEVINALREILIPPVSSQIWTRIREELQTRLFIPEEQAKNFLKEAEKYKVIIPKKLGDKKLYIFNPNFGKDNELPL